MGLRRRQRAQSSCPKTGARLLGRPGHRRDRRPQGRHETAHVGRQYLDGIGKIYDGGDERFLDLNGPTIREADLLSRSQVRSGAVGSQALCAWRFAQLHAKAVHPAGKFLAEKNFQDPRRRGPEKSNATFDPLEGRDRDGRGRRPARVAWVSSLHIHCSTIPDYLMSDQARDPSRLQWPSGALSSL